jgi:putative redox protein
MATTRVKWIEDKSFLGIGENGRSIVMSPSDGPGVTPMQLVLMALGGCAAVDIVEILRKQREPLTDFEVVVTGERAAELPKPYETIQMRFIFTGAGLDAHKVERAVDLAVEKYCGVHATLSGVAHITHGVEIRQAEVGALAGALE